MPDDTRRGRRRDPNLNEIAFGGGWPTLTLDSRGAEAPEVTVLPAPTDAVATAAVKNKRTATVTLTWTDNASSETGYLVQRAYNANFTSGVVNATLGPNTEAFSQTVSRGTIYYYRVVALNDTTQSGWSNTATITTP